MIARFLLGFATLLLATHTLAYEPSGLLEIHYVNVGQGGCTLIIGPDGTRILYDFGNRGAGKRIVKYIKSIGIQPDDGVHYAIVSHRDSDHYNGYLDMIRAGYDVLVANFGPGSPKHATPTMKRQWLSAALKKTTAGAVRTIPLGLSIHLGNGASARVVSRNGYILGHQRSNPNRVAVSNENDRSIALLVDYGNFQYLLDGDLGGGEDLETGNKTGQKNVQGPLAETLLREGVLSRETGVDVLHISHHGSESSTTLPFVRLMKPEVGLISVGNSASFGHPRKLVVDKVLRGAEQPISVFQTEDGIQNSKKQVSFKGLALGDIRLTTDGEKDYRIQGNNSVIQGAKEARSRGWTFKLDERD